MSDSGTAVRMRRLALAMMPLVLVCAGAWLVVKPGAQDGSRGGRTPVGSRRSAAREGLKAEAEAEADGHEGRAKARAIRELDELLSTAKDNQIDRVVDKVAETMVDQPVETLQAVLAAPEGAPRQQALLLMALRFPKEHVKELLVALRDSRVESDALALTVFFARTSELPRPAEVERLFHEDPDGRFNTTLVQGLAACIELESEEGKPHDAPPLYANDGMDPVELGMVNDALLECLADRQPWKALVRLEEILGRPEEVHIAYPDGAFPEAIFGHMGEQHKDNPEVKERVLELAARYGEKRTVVPFAADWAQKYPDEAAAWVLAIPDPGMRARTATGVVDQLAAGGTENTWSRQEMEKRFTEAGVDLRGTQ